MRSGSVVQTFFGSSFGKLQMSAVIATGWDFYTYLWQWYKVDMTHNTSKQDKAGHQISGFSKFCLILNP